jgi:flagellin-like hook-associated protein FlgL
MKTINAVALAVTLVCSAAASAQSEKLFERAAGPGWSVFQNTLTSEGYLKGGLIENQILALTAYKIARERGLLSPAETETSFVAAWLKAHGLTVGEKISEARFRALGQAGHFRLLPEGLGNATLTAQAVNMQALEAAVQQLRSEVAKLGRSQTQLSAAEKRLGELQTQLTALERGGATVAQLDGLKKQVGDLGRSLTTAETRRQTDSAQLQDRMTAVEGSWWGRFGPWLWSVTTFALLAVVTLIMLRMRQQREERDKVFSDWNKKILSNSSETLNVAKEAKAAAQAAASAASAAKSAAHEATEVATMARGAASAAQSEAERAVFASNLAAADVAELKRVVPMVAPSDAAGATPLNPAPSGVDAWAMRTGPIPAQAEHTEPGGLTPADDGIVVMADGRKTDSAPLAAADAVVSASDASVVGIPRCILKSQQGVQSPVVA